MRRSTLFRLRMMIPMPTYEMRDRFLDDLRKLTRAERALFKLAVDKMVEDFKGETTISCGPSCEAVSKPSRRI